MEYKCECGKVYFNSQAFNGHKSHCLVHLGADKYNLRKEQQLKNMQAGRQTAQEQAKLRKENLEISWNNETHICEHCGKVMTKKYGSGRFCCQSCANAHVKKDKQEQDEKRFCKQCGKELLEKKHTSYCSKECKAQYLHYLHYKKYLADNSIAYGIQNMSCYKKFFLEEQHHKCAICGCEDVWNNKQLIFVLDHIDGNADNNKRDNLRLICPNCDSQLNTFKSKNKCSARAKYRKVISKEKYDELTNSKD